MILYFSGTGNSRFAARLLSRQLQDQLVSINDYLKKEQRGKFHSEKPWVIVCPTYAWRMPAVVSSFLTESSFSGCQDIYFVLTCGGNAGNAEAHLKKLVKKMGLAYRGCREIVMPDNYLVMFPIPDKDTCKTMVEKAIPSIHDTGKTILARESFPPIRRGLLAKLESGPVNTLFQKYQLSAKGFSVSKDTCISCGQCEMVCPLNNIDLVKDKPVWGDHCTHCMACIGICPKNAISYKKASAKHGRYYLP